jgi:hypothetical protein
MNTIRILLLLLIATSACAVSQEGTSEVDETQRLSRVIRTNAPGGLPMVHASIHVPSAPFTDGILSVYVRMDPDYVRAQPGLGRFGMGSGQGALELWGPDERGGQVRWFYLDQKSEPEQYEGRVHLYHFVLGDYDYDQVVSYRYDLLARDGFSLVYRNALGDFPLQHFGKNWIPEPRP